MRRWYLVAVVATVAIVALWWGTRPRLSDEQQIASVILDLTHAVQAKNSGVVLKHISDDYEDGSLTKGDLTRLAIQAFRSAEPFQVHAEEPRIALSGDRAQVEVRVYLAVGAASASQPLGMDITIDFVRTRRGWKVVRAAGWERASEIIGM